MDEGETTEAVPPAEHEQETREAPSPLGIPAARAGNLLGGRFRLLARVGQGGMGVVFRAHDVEADREVAVKLLTARDLRPAQAERFQREGQLAAAVNHPGVVRVHASGIGEDGRPYLVYELVDGARTLADVLPHATLPAKVELVRQAADALGAAHRAGIVHRDVKPDNLLVDANDRVRVTDFGAALQGELARLTLSGVIVGTPAFMAPEQLDAAREAITPQTDVWALGVVLYEAVCGVSPFPARSLVELGDMLRRGRYASPTEHTPDLPPALVAVIRRCLERSPAARYPDGAALAADLAHALDPPTWSSATLDLILRPGKTRLVWAVAAVVLLAAALGGAYSLHAARQDTGPDTDAEALAWQARVLTPWAFGLGVSPTDAPTRAELATWRARLAASTGERTAAIQALDAQLQAAERLLAHRAGEAVERVERAKAARAPDLVVDAIVLRARGELPAARAAARRALDLDPGFVPAQLLELRLLSAADPAQLLIRLRAGRPFAPAAKQLAAALLRPLAEQAGASFFRRDEAANALQLGRLDQARRRVELSEADFRASLRQGLESAAPRWATTVERASLPRVLALSRSLAPCARALAGPLPSTLRAPVERSFGAWLDRFLQGGVPVATALQLLELDEVLTYELGLPGRDRPALTRLLRSIRTAPETRNKAEGRLRYHMAVLRTGLPMWASNLVKTVSPEAIQGFLRAHPESQAARFAAALQVRLTEDGSRPALADLEHVLQGSVRDLAPIYLGELHYWRAAQLEAQRTDPAGLLAAADAGRRLLHRGDEHLRRALGYYQRGGWLVDLTRWQTEVHTRAGEDTAAAAAWTDLIDLLERRLKRLGPQGRYYPQARITLAGVRWSAAQALGRAGARAPAVDHAQRALKVFVAENREEAAAVRAFLAKRRRPEAKRAPQADDD